MLHAPAGFAPRAGVPSEQARAITPIQTLWVQYLHRRGKRGRNGTHVPSRTVVGCVAWGCYIKMRNILCHVWTGAARPRAPRPGWMHGACLHITVKRVSPPNHNTLRTMFDESTVGVPFLTGIFILISLFITWYRGVDPLVSPYPLGTPLSALIIWILSSMPYPPWAFLALSSHTSLLSVIPS